MTAWSEQARASGKSIGFVPTMGALHPGHLSLVSKAKAENKLVVSSIFVNPIQFNKPEDLKHYPRTPEQDMAALSDSGCDVVFCPDVKEMYPEPESQVYDFGMLDKVMEGSFRQGHFNGVAIVVKKLFDIVRPHNAYFGTKDYQQLQIIRVLVRMEKIPVNIIACPTIREPDGLAMSSRNMRLGTAERKAAPLIYQTLQGAKERIARMRPAEVKEWAVNQINANPFLQTEYFEIADADTLMPAEQAHPNQTLVACTAVYAGNIRLIDNILLND